MSHLQDFMSKPRPRLIYAVSKNLSALELIGTYIEPELVISRHVDAMLYEIKLVIIEKCESLDREDETLP